MKTRNLLISSLALLVVFAGVALAAPVELYLVELTPGVNAYRYAGKHNWPVYYTQGNLALVGKIVSRQECPEVASIVSVYKGSSENLKWVRTPKRKDAVDYNGKALFRQRGVALVESALPNQAMAKGWEGFMVHDFSNNPIVIRPTGEIGNPALVKDMTIAALAQTISITNFQATVETLQMFLNRNSNGPYNEQAADWLSQAFSSFGISDVKQDTFTFTSWYYINDTIHFKTDTCHNVIATIPGTLDTSTVYVVGGHYDTSVWLDCNPYDTLGLRGPGADDNASGTAAAVEMARIFAVNPPNCTVKFIPFDCEEFGLYGSNKAATDAYAQGTNIGGMLNYDMIGNLGNESLFKCYQYDGSEYLGQLLGQCATWYGTTSDTNLIPSYVNDNSSGSDSWEYWNLGYPVTYSEEYYFSPHWHKVTDSTTNMNMRYATSIVRAGAGFLATMANYPQKVKGLFTTDVGNGTQLYVQWQPNLASNVAGYWIRWGKNSGNYTDSMQVAGVSDTIGGLTADSLYFIGLTAVDADGKESPVITEATGTPKSAPLAPSGLAAAPVDSGITLAWKKNLELDLAGYNIYRRINGSSFDSLTTTTDTFLLNKPLSGANRYYYKIQAKDTDGNKGVLSDSAYCRPITLDQGILLVDETNNWATGSFPRDAQQDSFYNYILAGYKYEQHEYGSSAQKPILADFGPYSTVAWLADDKITFLASGAVSDIKSYLDAGGKIWLAGWDPTGDVRGSATYPADFSAGNMLYDYFKMSHAELSGTADSFKTAIGLKGYPDIGVDTLKYPVTIYGKTFRNIEALTPLAGADTIYVMDMKNNGSPYEGKACAVRDSGKTVFFGFPMYFMDREQAKLAIQKVMEEFGEPYTGVEGKPEDRELIREVKLLQNAPNPFKQTTVINYQIPKAGQVKLNIYNIAGQLVKTLVNGEQQAGSYTVKWNRQDSQNRQVSAGVYIYHLSIGDKTQSRKMIVLK